MNLFKYYTEHVIPVGFGTIWSAFRIWKDLMMSNYSSYVLLKNDDPFEECRSWFWCTLGEDEILSKDFYEYFCEIMRKVESGEERLEPFDMNKLNEIKDLVGDLIDLEF